MEEASPWSATYTQSAITFILEHVTSERVARKLFEYRSLLEELPDLGSPYCPEYPAARPPFPCRAIPVSDTPFTIYYMKQEEQRRLIIFCIEFQRTDPNARFSQIDWTTGSW